MNPQAYELWHEHFSGMIRMNPRWDAYDRIALELFRKKKSGLKVVEFGFTPKVSDWSKDRCFTQQLEWLGEQELGEGLVITQEEKNKALCERSYRKVKCHAHLEGIPNFFDEVLEGFSLKEADLVFMGEAMSGAYDWALLPKGCLVAVDQSNVFFEDTDFPEFKKVYSSNGITLWRKT